MEEDVLPAEVAGEEAAEVAEVGDEAPEEPEEAGEVAEVVGALEAAEVEDPPAAVEEGTGVEVKVTPCHEYQ